MTNKFQPDLAPVKDFLNEGNYHIFPGFLDVHVHLREPGFSYKETIKTGTAAAAKGGYTDVCAMPNVDPIIDSVDHLQLLNKIIKQDALINVWPYSAITIKQEGKKLVDFNQLSDQIIAFSDDGHGVQDNDIMELAMKKAKENDSIIAAHCEVNELLHGGYIHDGEYAKQHGHLGISSASEWQMIKRDLDLAKKTGCKYHVCHISTKESVELIRQAKKEGIDVSCETAPHYLLLDESMLQEDGRFKMNPPLRTKEDQEALIKGIQDGTIDMIATDHAPHSIEEKNKGLKDSPFGIVGLETAFSLLYTYLVKTNIISLEKLIDLLCHSPRKRFGIDHQNNYTIFDLEQKYIINPDKFLSLGKNTPFINYEVYGTCIATVKDGKIVYRK